MPILQNISTKSETFLGFWRIDESIDELYNMLLPYLDACEITEFNQLKHVNRKKEWIASRLLIKELIGSYQRIFYNANRKPFIEAPFNISISHSNNLAGVLLSKREYVGLDIEQISEKIARVALKFLYKGEIENIDEKVKIPSLYVNWCAKETLFKAYGQRSLNFRENIKVAPFEFNDKGLVDGKIQINEFQKSFPINYFKINEYMVAWCAE